MPLPNFCKSLGFFCDHLAISVVFALLAFLLLAAPTIADHGSQEQIDTMVRDIVTGQKAWCQLFSEPGAGSDLAGLTTKAGRSRRGS